MHRLFFVLILSITTNVLAANVATLYQSSSPVLTQDEQERQQLAPDVLRQVMLKVVGDRAALSVVDVTPILTDAEKFIQQYQYQQVRRVTDNLTQADQLELFLTFNEASLNKSLMDMGLPVWGKSRPEALIWLAVDDSKSRTILGADSTDKSIVKSLNQAAYNRGLPILMPLMDLQDQAQVAFTDIWNDFAGNVEQGSQRYGTPVVVMISASISANGAVQTRWRAFINGESLQWKSQGNVNTAMQSGVDQLADELARRFSQVVTSQEAQQLSLKISNVRDYSDYSRVMKYLSTLQYVSDVRLSSLATDQLDISLSLKGDLTVFDQTLAIGRVLTKDAESNASQAIHYRLLP
ncbi:MAG: DUF2066 domain-containing protein [Gammaproteobacteria bacterium]|nr:DUF2066 domain-containing protein [Gammaproteobacteria bacterium]